MLALRCKNILIQLAISLLAISLLATPALAIESTQSATPSSSLQAKLKALQVEIASKAARLKSEVGKKLQNKAYLGFVKSVSDNSLTLATFSDSKIVSLDEFTEYKGFAKTSKKKGVAVDDFVAALGDTDEVGVLKAKRIVKLTSPPQERQIIFGAVLSLGEETITLQDKNNQNISLSVSSDTSFKTLKGEASILEDIQVNKPVIVVGISPKQGFIKADEIYLLSSSSPFKIKTKPATPSAHLKKK